MERSTQSKPVRLYIPIAGTWRTGNWYEEKSSFDHMLKNIGYTRVDQRPGHPDPGYWSGALGGLMFQAIVGKSKDGWQSGGLDLARFIRQRRQQFKEAESVTIIAHSHGGQVVAFALQNLLAAPGPNHLFNFRLVTVDMPVRTGFFVRITGGSMRSVYTAALVAVAGRWTHLYSERQWAFWKTRARWAGARGLTRKLKGAARNIEIPGHSAVLHEPDSGEWRNYLRNSSRLGGGGIE